MSDESSAPAVPLLHACLSCGLPVQSGDGPGEVAWHDCAWVEELRAQALPPPPKPKPGMETLLELVTQSISARADKFSARDLAEVLKAAADLRRAENERGEEASSGGGASLRLLAFVSR